MKMMANLFSMFDPSSTMMSMSWMIAAMPMIMMSKKQYKSKLSKATETFINLVKKQMEELMGNNLKKIFSLYMLSYLFMVIMMLNILAMMPQNFTMTAHLSVTFTMAMYIWSSVTIWGWVNSFNKMMTHLTPTGTPTPLMNFMVLIEMVSNLIRPITLSVRLSANMVAGHLLMTLLSNFSMMNYMNTIISSAFMVILTVLEIMVSMIQAYVLVTLSALYHNDSM